MKPVYSVVIPVYNEQEVLSETYKRLTNVMQSLSEPYELIFVNDGSKDSSEAILNSICMEDKNVKAIHFSRNFGHQPAVTAGMENSLGDATILIDADLQDPPEVIIEMAKKWKEGYEVVYGKRKARKGETFFKKITAKAYYRILNHMSSVDIPKDTGDFRLMDRKVLDVVNSLDEKNRYVRGLVSWVGFKQTAVEYVRDERFAGETKYPLKKMINFAMDGILSFSNAPLKIASKLGFLMSLASFIYLIVVILQKIFTNKNISGWTSIIAVLLLTQGIILIMLGIMGQYIGRIYDETQNRPNYIISNIVTSENFKNEDEKDTYKKNIEEPKT